jgi:hypothetical protein
MGIDGLAEIRREFDSLPCPIARNEKFFNEGLYRIVLYLRPYYNFFGVLLNGTELVDIEQSKFLKKVDETIVDITVGALYSIEIQELLEYGVQNSSIGRVATTALEELPSIATKSLLTLYALFSDIEVNDYDCELLKLAEDAKAMIATFREFKDNLKDLKSLFEFARDNNKQCNRTLIEVGGKQKVIYFINHFQATFYGAMQICLRLNMTLLTIDSQEEQGIIMEALGPTKNLTRNYFVGATDEGGKDNDYFWIDSGKPVNFQLSFHPGEPNNFFSGSSIFNKEDCLALGPNLSTKKYGFSDVSCNDPRNFICQRVVV